MNAAQSSREAARARFARAIARRYEKSGPRPMVKYWRLICDAAFALRPDLAGDAYYQRATVAALRFAKPTGRMGSAATDAWASNPLNVAELAASLREVLVARTVTR